MNILLHDLGQITPKYKIMPVGTVYTAVPFGILYPFSVVATTNGGTATSLVNITDIRVYPITNEHYFIHITYTDLNR